MGRIPALASQCGEYVVVGADEDDIHGVPVCAPGATGTAGHVFEYGPQLIARQVSDLTRRINGSEIRLFIVKMAVWQLEVEAYPR
jgi:hypothetical protein